MSKSLPDESRVIVALDYDNPAHALSFVERVSPEQCKLKVGKEMFTLAGPQFVEKLTGLGFDVFLDLKFHDIPNTVAKAVSAAADMGVWMTNVHASGGRRMMEATRHELDKKCTNMLLTAVTVLTSMDATDLAETGITISPAEQVSRLASLAKSSGMDGVVCSAQEAPDLRKQLGSDFCLVTPGIRPADAKGDDQKRVVTPKQAIANGSSYLVIGRPITRAEDPLEVLVGINREIG